MANWRRWVHYFFWILRWVHYCLVKVGELALPVSMHMLGVGDGWSVVEGLKTLTLLVLILAVIKEYLRRCFMHLYTRGVDDSPMVNLVGLGFFDVWGHLFVLVCVGVDLFGLETFTSIVVAIVVLKGTLRQFSLLHYPAAAAWQWVSEVTTWNWLTVLSVAFLSRAFVFLVLVCVAFIIEGPVISVNPSISFSDPIADDRGLSVPGFLSLRGQLLLLMCGGVGLVGLRIFTFITLGFVAIEWFLDILTVAAVDTTHTQWFGGVIEGPFSTSILSNLMDWRRIGFLDQFINLEGHMCLLLCGAVFLVGLEVFTLTPTVVGPLMVVYLSLTLNAVVTILGAPIFPNRRPRAVADALALALTILQEVQQKLFFLDPYPNSQRCIEWYARVKYVCREVQKLLDDDGGEQHDRCGLGICSTCKEAQKLLKNANDLAREGKRFVTELRRQDRILIYEHKYGMAMASHGMKVLDFVEGASSSWSSMLGMMTLIPAMRGVGKPPQATMGIWGMRGVGKTTLLRSVRDTYAHDAAASPRFDHVFLLGAGAGCTVDKLRHALSISIGSSDSHVSISIGSSDSHVVASSTISRYLRGRPFLLLLDDVRERLDLAAVGLPVPLGHRQKVVFTTRYRGVCVDMGCGTADTVIRMECLGEHDAWNLFKDKVGDEIIHAHPHIKHLAAKMVAECRGLPSALCTLGRAMSTKRDVKEWRYAYDVLLKCKPPEVSMGNEGYSHLHQLEDTLRESCFF